MNFVVYLGAWGAQSLRQAFCNASVAFYAQRSLEKAASGGEVSHLESYLPLRFPLRSSGKSATAFGSGFARYHS